MITLTNGVSPLDVQCFSKHFVRLDFVPNRSLSSWEIDCGYACFSCLKKLSRHVSVRQCTILFWMEPSMVVGWTWETGCNWLDQRRVLFVARSALFCSCHVNPDWSFIPWTVVTMNVSGVKYEKVATLLSECIPHVIYDSDKRSDLLCRCILGRHGVLMMSEFAHISVLFSDTIQAVCLKLMASFGPATIQRNRALGFCNKLTDTPSTLLFC